MDTLSRSLALSGFLMHSANPLHLPNKNSSRAIESLPSLLFHLSSQTANKTPLCRVRFDVAITLGIQWHTVEAVHGLALRNRRHFLPLRRWSGVNDKAFPAIWQDAKLPHWWINMDFDMSFGWDFRSSKGHSFINSTLMVYKRSPCVCSHAIFLSFTHSHFALIHLLLSFAFAPLTSSHFHVW